MPNPKQAASPFGRFWAPALMLVVLSVPCLPWPFLWDDFDFLSRALHFEWRNLLPSPGETLYRPVSRELYFAFVVHGLGKAPLLAHLVNLLLALGCLFLLRSLMTRVAGERAGIFAATLFAAAAWIPFLVGWASGAQDLLCLFFALCAFHAQRSGRTALAACAMALSVLSKETGLALIPVLPLLAGTSQSNARRRIQRSLLASGMLIVGWALIHPWPRAVLQRGLPSGSSDYVTFGGLETFETLLPAAMAALNITATWSHEWRLDIIITGILAVVLAVAALRSVQNADPPTARSPAAPNVIRVAGLLWFAGPVLLTSTLLKLQFPYYGLIPMAGLVVVAAPLLAHASRVIVGVSVLAFLALGTTSRMAVVEPKLLAEQNLQITAPAMDRVERGFRNLRPTMPPVERVFVYIQAAGRHGMYAALYRGQPLRVWYDDPRIAVLDPLRDRPRGRDELLFWISQDLNVYEVDIETLKPRGEGTRARFDEYQKTLRAYALGIAGSGNVDRAVDILASMPQYSETLRAYDRRTAAAILFASNRAQEAQVFLSNTPHFQRDDAIEEVVGLVAKPVPGLDLDLAAMRAFELEPSDSQAVQTITNALVARGYGESARRFESRLKPL